MEYSIKNKVVAEASRNLTVSKMFDIFYLDILTMTEHFKQVF